jgi:WD40 repeat protein
VFSPDGTRVITATSEGTVRVWDATNGKPVTAPLEHPGGVKAAVFSPDGTRVITANSANTVRVWPIWKYVDSLDDWRLQARCSRLCL